MAGEISLVVVNYRTSHLVPELIRSARAASRSNLEVIVVDNSVDESEVRALRELDLDRLVVSESNVGFASALNRGVRHAESDLILAANPDVVFGESSVDQLASSITGPVGASGPRFFWDESESWLLPPPEAETRRERIQRSMAERGIGRFDRELTRKRLSFWERSEPEFVATLSGAVMMIDRGVYDQVGGMDSRFRLYFEEVDFFRRVRALGVRVVHDPAAHCRHMFGRSAAANPTARQWFAESERQFHEKWHGRWFHRALQLLARPGTNDRLADLPPERERTDGSSVLELSVEPTFTMAAGNLESRGLDLPHSEIREGGFDSVYVREVERCSGEVLWQALVKR